ncbi:unnamed protein product [Eruca vesicaria subsp. sativa]|uniref:Uncharacterized protein n=1 Tax=Eruca vesicaria subsp. sativa TaxID=29727 RepID=A0ABC8JLJ1_ERUVS|nr:unnamed protein product [Eruca vesicaria subsp. sativa]
MEHQFLIRFLPSTRLGEVHTNVPIIKSDRFMVRRYDHLQVLASTNLELPISTQHCLVMLLVKSDLSTRVVTQPTV